MKSEKIEKIYNKLTNHTTEVYKHTYRNKKLEPREWLFWARFKEDMILRLNNKAMEDSKKIIKGEKNE